MNHLDQQRLKNIERDLGRNMHTLQYGLTLAFIAGRESAPKLPAAGPCGCNCCESCAAGPSWKGRLAQIRRLAEALDNALLWRSKSNRALLAKIIDLASGKFESVPASPCMTNPGYDPDGNEPDTGARDD